MRNPFKTPMAAHIGLLLVRIPIGLIFIAADRYPWMSAGDVPRTSAMLSNPELVLSAGSNVVTSTSRSSRSRTAFAYSLRFMRWTDGDPGLG